MDDARFWELVAELDGVADAAGVARLTAALRPDEADPFGEQLQRRVDEVLQRCEVPASHAGDTAEWIAAAVVAAGRETHDRVVGSGRALEPDAWRWQEAELLLVAGAPADEPGGSLGDLLDVHLQWRSATAPPGVDTPAAAEPGSAAAEALALEPDVGDDPSWGRVPTSDPAWDAALAVLAADPEFQRRRALVAEVGLHVVVRDADEATLTAYPADDATEAVALVVPVADHLDEVGAPLPLEERVQVHLDAVVTLLVETQSALGRD